MVSSTAAPRSASGYPTSPKRPPKFTPLSSRKATQNTFTCFSKLPFELRLYIWRLAFPGPRNVRIDLGILRTPRAQVPLTLSINRESRAETLKHYAIVFPTDIFKYDSDAVTPPFCFNAAIDSVFFIATVDLGKHEFENWLDHLHSHLPGGLNSIRILNIIWPSSGLRVLPKAPKFERLKKFPLAVWILKFAGLDKLAVEEAQRHYRGKDQLKQDLEEFLDFFKDKFVSGLRPELKVRS